MDEDLACVNRHSISSVEVDVSGIPGQKNFKEVQETQVAKDFIKLESGELKNNSGKANGGLENDSTGSTEGLPTTVTSLDLVDENQEFKGLSKAEEKLSLGSMGDTAEVHLLKSAGYESILVSSANEAGETHPVKSTVLENRNETVSEPFMTNGEENSVNVKLLRGNLKIKVIDDTAVIDCTSITSGNGYTRPRTDEKRDRRTRRREKGGKRDLEANGKGKTVLQIVELPKKEIGMKKIYSRKEMELLRYINPEEQRRLWMVVRCCLGPVVLKEYDGLKQIRVNFDPRQQFAKKEVAPAMLGTFSNFFMHFCVHYRSLKQHLGLNFHLWSLSIHPWYLFNDLEFLVSSLWNTTSSYIRIGVNNLSITNIILP